MKQTHDAINCLSIAQPMTIAMCLLFSGCQIIDSPESNAQKGSQHTAIYSVTDKDYKRAQYPDGSFESQTYELRNGGNFGGPRVDASIDNVSYETLSKAIEEALLKQNYHLGADSKSNDLLIIVFWGTTIVPDDVMPHSARQSVSLREQAAIAATGSNETTGPAVAALLRQEQSLREQSLATSEMEGRIDSRIDANNANILGYTDQIVRTPAQDPNQSTLRYELEHDRYYVVLLAYDYQAARKFGIHKLLWETRFSIPEQGTDFSKAFPAMVSIASKYFGQNSNGLIHHNLDEGHVEIGQPTILGGPPGK